MSTYKSMGNTDRGRISKADGDPADMNDPLSAQPRRRSLGAGASGREAGLSAGAESGCYMKERMGSAEATDESELGKPLAPFGAPPWQSAPMVAAGGRVSDTFGAGEQHQIKNG